MKCIKVKSFILKHQYQMWKNICRAPPHHCQSEIVYCCDIRQLVMRLAGVTHGNVWLTVCLKGSCQAGKLSLSIRPQHPSTLASERRGVSGVTTQQYTPVHQPSLFCFPQTAGAVLQHQIFPTHIGISISYISEKLGNWSVGTRAQGNQVLRGILFT